MTALPGPGTMNDELHALCAHALSAAGRPAVIAGEAAALMHRRLWLATPASPWRPETVLLARGRPPRSVTPTQRRDVWTRRRSVAPDEIEIVDGLPVTSPARTWTDLAATLSLPDLVALGDSLLRARPESGEHALQTAIRRARGQRGVLRARAAFPMLDARSRSRPESHMRCALVMGGLPRPEVNIPILDDHGGWLAEPDLVYEEARLTLEYNGADHATVNRMRRDISRTLDVELGNWHQVVFGPRQVFGHPHLVVAHVRALLDVRDPTWRSRVLTKRPPRLRE